MPRQLSKPFMPKAKMQTKEDAFVKAARQHYETAKYDLLIKTQSIARLQKKYNDNKSPALKRAIEKEHKLIGLMAEKTLKPVIQRYSDALVRMTSANQSVVKNYKSQLVLQTDIDFLSNSWFEQYSLTSNAHKKMLIEKYARAMLIQWKNTKSVKIFNELLLLNAQPEMYGTVTSPAAKEVKEEIQEFFETWGAKPIKWSL